MKLNWKSSSEKPRLYHDRILVYDFGSVVRNIPASNFNKGVGYPIFGPIGQWKIKRLNDK